MAFERGRFGIEYSRRRADDDGSSGLGWLYAAVALAALVSFAWIVKGRLLGGGEDDVVPSAPAQPAAPAAGDAPPAAVQAPPAPEPALASLPDALRNRPVKARNLLMRLAEAERSRDMEMAVTTIEQLRTLPGSPVADLDDKLARRLGDLNMIRLFEGRCGQWVKSVTVKRGDSASRIAAENGSTLASLARLNGGSVDRIVLGRNLYVMDHPRFSLAIRRRTRIADLSLNGKFFRRYDLVGAAEGRDGAYETAANPRALWRSAGVEFSPDDRAELDLLLPAGSRVLVSEL